ncbi:MAG: porin [Lutibacter sp.]|uniref:porin n=1 Tax=Lutibacter sp. TaxID=1925666 RepID=UPI00299E769B|nr:porin [Lutibacter sp.]MDX1828878.1 porin [Lutibacter sp.]
MKNIIMLLVTTLITLSSYSQQKETSSNLTNKFTLGGYGQIDYNEPNGNIPGNLDVHRVVLFVGYKFTEKVSFVSEIEFEHVREEAGLEQAYVKYQVADNVNVLAGLMLIPMGIINQEHEPTTFYGVERPNVDTFIVPSTWREIGLGVSGNINSASIKYQVYLFNGFKSYANGIGLLNSGGFHDGKQEGMESIINTPNLSMKMDYYGVTGLRLGLAGYFGKTQTDNSLINASTVGVAMLGLDARYTYKKLELRGQYIHTSITNTINYNALTGNDLGSAMNGFYLEAAFNFPINETQKITPFIRYEKYNTQAKTAGNLVADKANDKNELLVGLNYKVADGVAFKVDYQFINNAVTVSDTQKQFNAGVAVWF